MDALTTAGIHHVTAIASNPQRNLDFYTDVLGLRLVKLTVNFDDPGTYHFYFGNDDGSPGSILTFFPWPGARLGTVGNGQLSATSFAVPVDAIAWWEAHLTRTGLTTHPVETRFGERVLGFADPDGLPLELVGTTNAEPSRGWRRGPIDAGRAIGGFHSATLAEKTDVETVNLLSLLGLELIASEGIRHRYRARTGGMGSLVDVVVDPHRPWGRGGAGTVHHIAWRAADDDEQTAWRASLTEAGYAVTPVMDRSYFRSIYFREPGGILFEIATDPPGFAIDEAPDRLGEALRLPASIGARREAVERALPTLRLPHERPA